MHGLTRRQFMLSGSALAAATALQPLFAPAALSLVPIPDFITVLNTISMTLKVAVLFGKLGLKGSSLEEKALLERCAALVQQQDFILSEVRKVGIVISSEVERAFREDITLDLSSELATLRIITADMTKVQPDEDLRRTALSIGLLISRIGKFGPVTFPSVCGGISALNVLHEILGTSANMRAAQLRDQAGMLRRWLQQQVDGSLSARLKESQDTYERAVLVGNFKSVSVAEISYLQDDYVALESVKIVKVPERAGSRFVQSGPFRVDEIGLPNAGNDRRIAPYTIRIRFIENPNLAARFECFSLTRAVELPGASSSDVKIQQYIREQTKRYIDCVETFSNDYAVRRDDLEQKRQNLIVFSNSIEEAIRILDDAADKLAPLSNNSRQ